MEMLLTKNLQVSTDARNYSLQKLQKRTKGKDAGNEVWLDESHHWTLVDALESSLKGDMSAKDRKVVDGLLGVVKGALKAISEVVKSFVWSGQPIDIEDCRVTRESMNLVVSKVRAVDGEEALSTIGYYANLQQCAESVFDMMIKSIERVDIDEFLECIKSRSAVVMNAFGGVVERCEVVAEVEIHSVANGDGQLSLF